MLKAQDFSELNVVVVESLEELDTFVNNQEPSGFTHNRKEKMNEQNTSGFSFRPDEADFLRKYCPATSTDADTMSRVLGWRHSRDAVLVCSNTPFCLYLFHGVEIDISRKVGVLLVGFFNKATGQHSIRLLHVFPPEELTATAMCFHIVETLHKLQIPLVKMAMFYSDHPDHQDLLSGLKKLKLVMVSLCPLANMMGRVCHDAVEAMEFSGQIQNLISEVYKHYSSLPGDVQSVLEKVEDFNGHGSASRRFCRTIQGIASAWPELEKHFESVDEPSLFVSNPQVKLGVLFLAHALQPLWDFQERLDQGVGVMQLLQDASQLVKFYTSRFLRPKAVEFFLRRLKASLLHDSLGHLPPGEVEVGEQASVFLLEKASELSDHTEKFHSLVISFYTAATLCVLKHLPFPNSILRNFSLLLSPEKRLEVPSKVVQDLGTCFGLCSSPMEVSLLNDEFLEYQFNHDASPSLPTEQFWSEKLMALGAKSCFGKLVCILLALPRTLKKEVLFEELLLHLDVSMDVVEDDVTDSGSYKSAPSHLSSVTSDIIDLTEDFESVEVVLEDPGDDLEPVSSDSDGYQLSNEDEDDVIIVDDCYKSDEEDKTAGCGAGEMVWAPVRHLGLWPGLVQSWNNPEPCGSKRKVQLFDNKLVCEIHVDELVPFSSFSTGFSFTSMWKSSTYKDAIFTSLQVASRRSRMFFVPEVDDKDELLHLLLNWAFGGFQPLGPEALQQKRGGWTSEPVERFSKCKDRPEKLLDLTVSLKKLPESLDLQNCFVKTKKRTEVRQKPKAAHRKKNKIQQTIRVESRLNSQNRYNVVREVLENKRGIEDICLACGSTSVEIVHPLFVGSLCSKCKYNFTETLYRYDEDGYQSYCTVCCSGMEVILCGRQSCCRSYCVDCLEILVGVGTSARLRDVDPWFCFLCAPESSSGALRPRPDWSVRVQEFFANNNDDMEFEPHRVYPSIPAFLRRPIRVLSLFDGIATGYLVLRDLGFKLEKYVASEIDENSITISMINHEGKITHVDEVRRITKQHIMKWGPFDLLIGGSPCNDLSIVNPARKGLFEGTGRLFFDYYRVLNFLKPKEDDPQPFFWLFENVTFMSCGDKTDICRFLECNPVRVDAVNVSPAHRARYFWGNIPGMNRPMVASLKDKLTLQECLEVGRIAKCEKVRTITTQPNSIKQGREMFFPITMNGKEDNIWITEMEKIFGFPKHYTDVMNMSRAQRQKVLGKSWSVPVIRHLFAPLKDYFACDEISLK